MICSAFCLKDDQCQNFAIIKDSDTKKAECKSIKNYHKLVKTSTKNAKKLEVYQNKISDTNNDDLTHFLLINTDNEIKDISLDPDKSPELAYSTLSFEGIDSIPNDCPRSWFFKEDEMTLMTTGPCKDSNKMFSWSFDDTAELKYIPG